MSVPARAYLSIGEVLTKLRGDFPDITISKIRFLESEGLIEPQRTPSGYRKFTSNDLERLRYVLLAQRDQYLPLKVIKENLDATWFIAKFAGRRELFGKHTMKGFEQFVEKYYSDLVACGIINNQEENHE